MSWRVDVFSEWLDVPPVRRPTLAECRSYADAQGDLADYAVITDEACRVVEQRLRVKGSTWIRFFGPPLY